MDVSRIYEFLACRAKAKHVVGDDLMSETSPQKVVQSRAIRQKVLKPADILEGK